MRTLALKLAMASGSVVLVLAGAEVTLRWLPVASGMPAVAVNARQPVFHLAPNREAVMASRLIRGLLP